MTYGPGNARLDSRIHLATGDTHVALSGSFDPWVNVGVDTATWRYAVSEDSDLAGPDFSISEDSSGIVVANTCTVYVRFAFQMSRLHGADIGYAAPTYATTHGSGFPGLISGDGDPIGQAINDTDQDLIFDWIWRVEGGSTLTWSVTVLGSNEEETDGFEVQVVRIA